MILLSLEVSYEKNLYAPHSHTFIGDKTEIKFYSVLKLNSMKFTIPERCPITKRFPLKAEHPR